MKKMLFTLLVAISALAANAQMYVGGEVGLWRNNDAHSTDFVIQPEVGFQLSDSWAIGLNVGFAHSSSDNLKVNGFVATPYARYTYLKLGSVNLFLDGGFGFNTYKQKGYDESCNAWQVGVSPGISVRIAKNFNFIAHVGFLGYRDSDAPLGHDAPVSAFGDDGFGFRLSSNDLRFGLYYDF